MFLCALWVLLFPPDVRGSGRQSASPASNRLNVLFLFADDMRFDTIAALGNREIRSPHLDRLVDQGFVFEQCCIMGSTMPAVCIPSRAMLMSGRSLWRTPTDLKGVPSLPEILRQQGVVTFATGKWHNGKPSFARAFSAGRAIFFGGMTDHSKVPIYDFDPTGQYRKSSEKVGEKFSSELFAHAAIEFLRGHSPDQPFFCYVGFCAPHDPRTPPEAFARLYDPAKLTLPGNFLPEHPFDNGELKVRDELLAPFPRTPEVIREHLAAYYGMISHLDAEVGRILQTLEELGLAAKTIIVFSADNGLAVGQHGLLGKQNLYEHSVRVPLVLKGPNVPRGRSKALVYLHDLMPTLCDVFGVPAPEGVEGRTLWPIIRGETETLRDCVLLSYRNEQRAIRRGNWKLIMYEVQGRSTVQLFDLANDPEERENLTYDPKHAQTRTELEKLLFEARAAAGDPLISSTEMP